MFASTVYYFIIRCFIADVIHAQGGLRMFRPILTKVTSFGELEILVLLLCAAGYCYYYPTCQAGLLLDSFVSLSINWDMISNYVNCISRQSLSTLFPCAFPVSSLGSNEISLGRSDDLSSQFLVLPQQILKHVLSVFFVSGSSDGCCEMNQLY